MNRLLGATIPLINKSDISNNSTTTTTVTVAFTARVVASTDSSHNNQQVQHKAVAYSQQPHQQQNRHVDETYDGNEEEINELYIEMVSLLVRAEH